jgi:hypothetical protein
MNLILDKMNKNLIIAKQAELDKVRVEYIIFLEGENNPYRIKAHNLRDEMIKLESELAKLHSKGEDVDLIQYVTNLLYYAHNEGTILNSRDNSKQ